MTATDDPEINHKMFASSHKFAVDFVSLLFSISTNQRCPNDLLVFGFKSFCFLSLAVAEAYHISSGTGTDPFLAKHGRLAADRAECNTQQLQSSVCVYGWPVKETGFVLHTRIVMN